MEGRGRGVGREVATAAKLSREVPQCTDTRAVDLVSGEAQ